ncbi:hypothetical protein B0H10DRAFT_2228948 [Mycena sp. CBHHK59/15]|nr:hypothetical protein B0H10DRAFT_2240019 [Mycena sp. CBHHK59/15]KAJ6605795.1 hypothetical protein B0H10DRAFT_2228948 [Mycena sp. CBHHK59/15]
MWHARETPEDPPGAQRAQRRALVAGPTACKSPSQNVAVLNRAAIIAQEWAKTVEKSKTELIHHPPGRGDLSDFNIEFDGETIRPSEAVKWIGVWIDSKLRGEVHIKARAASAARALNASLALTHAAFASASASGVGAGAGSAGEVSA